MTGQRRIVHGILIAGGALLAAAITLLFVSASGSALFGFRQDTLPALADGDVIRGWADFEQDSYLIGDIARYRIRVLWQSDRVTPDLDAIPNSVSLRPLDRLGTTVDERRVAGALREFRAEFELQVVAVDSAARYTLDALTVYYTRADEGDANVHALRLNAPTVHVGEYYAGDAAATELQPPKPVVHDARVLRRTLMALCGTGIGLAAVLLLWRTGRRRSATELSAAERCWRDVQSFDTGRANLAGLERLFTTALQMRTGISAVEFWSGRLPADTECRDLIDEARALLDATYRPAGSGAAGVARVTAIIEELLAPLAEREQLQREMHDNARDRLRAQPAVLAAGIALVVFAAGAFLLAALPSIWVAGDVKRYNAAAELIDADTGLHEAVDAFAVLADEAGDSRIRAAALYNLGTLLADPRMSRLSREQHRNFREAIFLPVVTLERLLHDLDLDAEFELVTLLSELTRQYVQAEQALQAAVRAAPEDPDPARNLEVLGKIRRAIGRSLAQLVENNVTDGDSPLAQTQTVIDLRLLMETELPDEFARIDDGKDDRDYFIMERF